MRSLPEIVDIDIYLQRWKSRIHSDETRQDMIKEEILRKAYEFALKSSCGIGQDKDSGDIWLEYIQFLEEARATSTRDSQQIVGAVREAFYSAVKIPLYNVERIWSDLVAFENKLDPITAKSIIADLTLPHMRARAVYQQLMNRVQGLYPPAIGPAQLEFPEHPTFSLEDRMHTGRWKTYLKWEESNPLEIEEKDWVLRVQSVYKKALVYMRYYPEIW